MNKKTRSPARQTPPTRPASTPRAAGYWLYGLHAAGAAWTNPKRKINQLRLADGAQNAFAPFLAEAQQRGLNRPQPHIVTRAALDQLLPGTVHQGIALDAAALPDVTLDDLIATAPRLLLVLDQVTDPHNVGAMLRSAAAFGADGVIVTDRHAPSATGTLAKTASGALEYVPLVAVVNLARTLDQLRAAGIWCVGLAEEGRDNLAALDLTGPTAIVMGAEGDGLRRLTRERCDMLARLPTQPPIGSLNVSNAAAVALYEVRRQNKT